MNLLNRARLISAALAMSAPVAQAAAQPVPVAQHTEAVAAPPKVDNQLVVSMAAGATINAGNTESYAGNAGGSFGLIRPPHQLTANALGTVGYSAVNEDADVEQTSANVIGRVRYDLFLSQNDALFLAIAPRRDTFAGLNLRMQNQAGYLRNLYAPTDSHRLWTEVGYDLTYDVFSRVTTSTTEDVTGTAVRADGTEVMGTFKYTTTSSTKPDSEVIHSARLFFGYTNVITPAANLNLGAEILYDFQDSENVRVNGLAELTTSIAGAFKLGVQSRLFYDNVPAPTKKDTDLVLALQLIYTFDSLAGKTAPPCDCTSEVAAAKAECVLEAAQSAPTVLEPAVEPAPADAAPAEPAPAVP